ncbi:MAG: type II toxin-antitoxin system prevent-host-death family antitoxin [Wenzhouxiangella sp.]|jgi:prevent-host-death family protein|nr:type II toxin-antitoxin system prevent-host-death family antitoxin [Wenzhouxiangella sp.]
MKMVGVVDARKDFARLLDAVESGEEVVITRRGLRIARLVPDRGQSAAAAFEAVWADDFSELEAPEDAPSEPIEPL